MIPKTEEGRKLLLVSMVIWATIAILTGSYGVVTGGLGAQDVIFLTSVTAIINIAAGFYFKSRK